MEGRVAIVTGGGRGIGAEIVRLLASEGARVVVNDYGVALDGTVPSSAPADDLVREINEAGGHALASAADVSDHEAAEGIIKAALEGFGRLDVLINVAGILRDRMIFNMSEDDWDAVIRVHLKGTFNTCKWAAAHWRGQRDPHAHNRIINFSSGSGILGSPGQPNYAAAKMGIIGLTLSCANALRGYGVTSNAIVPGATTRMMDNVPPEQLELDHFMTVGDPDELAPANVAPAVAYLASTASDWCNGQIIGAWGYQVTLYSHNEPVRQISSTQPWDVDRLGRLMDQVFKPIVGTAPTWPGTRDP